MTEQGAGPWTGYPPPPPPPPWAAPPVAAYPPAVPPVNPWHAPGAPSSFDYAAPVRRGRVVAIVLAVIAAVLAGLIGLSVLVAAAVPGRSTRQSSRSASLPASAATASSPVLEQAGTTAFSDDFTDPSRGWAVGVRGQVDLSYGGGGLHAAITGNFDHFASSPYHLPQRQLRQSVQAAVSVGSPAGGGWGLTCARDINSAEEVHYEFHVTQQGRWFVERRDGIPSPTTFGSVLREGTFAASTAQPLTMTSMCLTLADGVTNRLVLFVAGVKVTDLTDVTAQSAGAWIGEVQLVGGSGGPTAVEVSHYDEGSVY